MNTYSNNYRDRRVTNFNPTYISYGPNEKQLRLGKRWWYTRRNKNELLNECIMFLATLASHSALARGLATSLIWVEGGYVFQKLNFDSTLNNHSFINYRPPHMYSVDRINIFLDNLGVRASLCAFRLIMRDQFHRSLAEVSIKVLTKLCMDCP